MNDSDIDQQQLEAWMKAALQIGYEGVSRGENAFGAGIFRPDGSTVVLQHNEARSQKDPTAHAEVRAIQQACELFSTTELDEAFWLVSTAEPCPMCLSAAALAGLRKIVFGAPQKYVEEAGYGSLGVGARELAKQFDEKMEIRGPVLEEEAKRFLLGT